MNNNTPQKTKYYTKHTETITQQETTQRITTSKNQKY